MRAGLIGVALALLVPAPALASSTQESLFQDDPRLLYSSDARTDETFGRLETLGVDRVRLTLLWRNLAPAPSANQRPAGFDAADPDAYPDGVWDPYDRAVRLAQKHGIAVLMNVTGPAPTWATAAAPRDSIQDTYLPDSKEFEAFTAAAGKRFSGTFRPGAADTTTTTTQPQQQPGLLPGVLSPAEPQPQPDPAALAAAARPPLPRVDAWSIWNEPNHPSWLTPQWLPDARSLKRPQVAVAAGAYRNLADGAWRGLSSTGHAADTILLGETAPRGWDKRGIAQAMRPLEFIREVFCLGPKLRHYTGFDAAERGCPRSPSERSGFVADHPGLFQVNGFAHHPYRFDAPPEMSDPQPDNATLADTGRLHITLSTAYRRWGQARTTPVWFTEYGYQTSPPDPFGGIAWQAQAAYLSHAAFMAFRDGRVASMAQFLLVDDAPRAQYAARDKRYWATFQTGLMTLDGRPKTALNAYARTFWVEPSAPRPGGRVTVFGQYKPAAQGVRVAARLQFRPRSGGAWRTLRTLASANPRGFFRARARVERAGSYRLLFENPATRAPEPSVSQRVSFAP